MQRVGRHTTFIYSEKDKDGNSAYFMDLNLISLCSPMMPVIM